MTKKELDLLKSLTTRLIEESKYHPGPLEIAKTILEILESSLDTTPPNLIR